MTSNASPLVLLGGTFDPVHHGHLWMAQAVYAQLSTWFIQPDLRFLPTARSPFKATQTSAKHRLALLKCALRDTPFAIDKTEIFSPPPVYTLDTLTTIRQRIGNDRPIILIIGQDSLDSLPRWKGGYDLLEKTHLWIFPRAGEHRHLTLPDALVTKQVATVEALIAAPAGSIYLDLNMPPAISSSSIREHLATSQTSKLLKNSLPKRVLAYTARINLYGINSPYES